MEEQKMNKKIVSLLLIVCMVLGMAACGTQQTTTPTQAPTQATAAPTQAPTTEATVKPVLLAVSFGTSYNDSRDLTIGAVESALQSAFPEYEVRRAFTSQIVIDILAERDKLDIDNVTEAMDRLVADGVKDVLIQPTHVMTGYEYDDVVAEVSKYQDKFDSLTISNPILVDESDYDALVKVLVEETAAYNTEGTAIAFMGHGTEHEANASYAKLEQKFRDAGYENYFVGTVEGSPLVEDVIQAVKETDAKKVVLLPLMIVAGDHANNDMSGDEEDSWKSAFTAAGYEVECVLKGLGQYQGVQDLLVSHATAAING